MAVAFEPRTRLCRSTTERMFGTSLLRACFAAALLPLLVCAGSRRPGPRYLTLLQRAAQAESGQEELATFAMGCFWGAELALQRVPGVLRTRVGYIGGTGDRPTYREVSRGRTEHAEAVQVAFDPKAISYADLLGVFWEQHDPTQVNRQGNDVGTQYRSAIFTHSLAQLSEARQSLQAEQARLEALWPSRRSDGADENENAKIATAIVHGEGSGGSGAPARVFWDAEEYHQRYLEKGGQSADKGETQTIRCYG